MPAQPTDVHLLTNTARMCMVVAETPDHQGGPDYARQIAAYKARWSALSAAQRIEVAQAAGKIHDMTESVIAAAVAALEG